MARQIEAYKLRTELSVDARQGNTEIRSFQKGVDQLGESFKKLGAQIDTAVEKKGKDAGAKFGKGFSAGAEAIITGSFDQLGTTIGSILGTAIAPGLGTAIGSTIGGAVDTTVGKIAGTIGPLIKQGIELNKELERTRVEFTTFTGSEKEAIKYLEDLKKLASSTGTDFKWLVDTSEKVYDLTGNLALTNKILKAATDQAADFGGEAETIAKVAEALGLMAEKGELAGRELQKLYKLGIDAKGLLSEATGLSTKRIEQLMAAGRIRGDVAAQLISEGIERQKGGFAAKIAATTTYGAERKFGTDMTLRTMEATEKATTAMGDFYRQADKIMSGPRAQEFTKFINDTFGKLVDVTKSGIEKGTNIAEGLGQGIAGSNAFGVVKKSVEDLGNYVMDSFDAFFQIQSPSKLVEQEIGIPIGQGIGQGVKLGFLSIFPETKEAIQETLKQLLEDPRISAFLDLIKTSEVGKDPNAAGRLFGKLGHVDPSQYTSGGGGWPGMSVLSPTLGRRVQTHPLGGYQIQPGTARDFTRATGIDAPMTQETQDMIATWLIAMRHPGALQKILSGDISGAIGALGGEWESFKTYNAPGKGGKGLVAQYTRALAGAVPVQVVAWGNQDINNAAAIFGPQGDINNANAIFGAGAARAAAGSAAASAAVENAKAVWGAGAAALAVHQSQQMLAGGADEDVVAMTRIVPRALNALTGAETKHAATAMVLTKKYQEAAREQLVIGVSFLTQLSSGIAQIAGFMPSETVGKKRSFISKVLGVAAPFLSFIPGVGPILSTIAGIASAGFGGNWGGVTTAVAGGLQTGGVFRRSPGISAGGAGASAATAMLEHRQYGGPVYAGRAYIVGEHGQETFTPARSGYITPQSDLLAVAAELRAAVGHLYSLPPHQVVMRGARGLVRAMDHDAGLIRLVSQRQRLA